jgi:hypothetical protein
VAPALIEQFRAGVTPDDVTVPLPEPAPSTVNWSVEWKLAVTFLDCVAESVHGPVPVHAPLQPPKTLPAAALASSVIVPPCAYLAAQVPVGFAALIVQSIAWD